MALHRTSKGSDNEFSAAKGHDPPDPSLAQSRLTTSSSSSPGHMYSHLLLLVAVLAIGIVLLAIPSSNSGTESSVTDTGSRFIHAKPSGSPSEAGSARYLYWGSRIDCPGKHCEACEGLGHQESSLRCALEEAMFLHRTFVMPSHMCINRIHNDKGILHHSNASAQESTPTDPSTLFQKVAHPSRTRPSTHPRTHVSWQHRWASNFCSMDTLYDMELISKTVPVILDNSKEWRQAISQARKLGDGGMIHVQGIDRKKIRQSPLYRDVLILNRTASPLSWFVECKDRNNHSAVMLPYTFLPSMASRQLREAAKQIKNILGDYDAIHVRRGDKLKVKKDRFGVNRTLHPHLDRDTRPEAINQRIVDWIPEGRTIFIASNERTPGFFSPLSVKYRLAYSSNFTNILDTVVQNNYQLFMLERLVLAGAKTFVKTFQEEPSDLSLTDDPKKNLRSWQIPIYKFDETPPS